MVPFGTFCGGWYRVVLLRWYLVGAFRLCCCVMRQAGLAFLAPNLNRCGFLLKKFWRVGKVFAVASSRREKKHPCLLSKIGEPFAWGGEDLVYCRYGRVCLQ